MNRIDRKNKNNGTDKNVCPTDNKDKLKITKRHLPHWTLKGAAYFVTFRTVKGQAGMPILLSIEEQKLVLQHILNGNGKFYKLIAVQIMPDHVHLIFKQIEGYNLSRIMKGIKGVTARKINLKRKETRTDRNVCSTGSIWQDESYDRIIRDQDELNEKINYMLNNPVEKGITDDPWNYHGWYFNPV